ncbi:MAG: hypothetical protein AAB787_00915 [Patescibacteria group bacterium]
MKIDWKKILAVVGGLVILAGISYLVLWLKVDMKPSEIQSEIQNGTSMMDNIPENAIPLMLKGIVRSIKRPAPDIPYDYSLEFTEVSPELEKAFSHADPPGVPRGVVILPGGALNQDSFETNIGKNVVIEGYLFGGYVESLVFTVLSIQPGLEKLPVDYTKPRGTRVGYVKKVYESNGRIYIDFDEAKFFCGEAAIKFLKENGGCTAYDGDGCFIPSGCIVPNKDEAVQSLIVKESSRVTVLSNGWDLVEPNGISITPGEFENNFGLELDNSKPRVNAFYVPSYPPYWINQDENGAITSIAEQYMP